MKKTLLFWKIGKKIVSLSKFVTIIINWMAKKINKSVIHVSFSYIHLCWMNNICCHDLTHTHVNILTHKKPISVSAANKENEINMHSFVSGEIWKQVNQLLVYLSTMYNDHIIKLIQSNEIEKTTPTHNNTFDFDRILCLLVAHVHPPQIHTYTYSLFLDRGNRK